jgi:hypothetical protein
LELAAAALRSLERDGLMESFINDDGEVHWRLTAKGIAVGDDDAAWQEDSRHGLDS